MGCCDARLVAIRLSEIVQSSSLSDGFTAHALECMMGKAVRPRLLCLNDGILKPSVAALLAFASFPVQRMIAARQQDNQLRLCECTLDFVALGRSECAVAMIVLTLADSMGSPLMSWNV